MQGQMPDQMPSQKTEKYLINCQDGFNNLERATIAFILAVSASRQAEVAMFVTAEAAALCVEGAIQGNGVTTDPVVAEGYESLASLFAAFMENGGKIWLCPACAKAKNITEGDLADGVEIAGAPHTMAFLQSGAKLLA